MRRGVDHRRAFTLLELIVIFTVVCILFALMIPATIKMREKQKRITCVNNLKSIGVAHRMSGPIDLFPWVGNTNLPAPSTITQVMTYYRGLSNEIANPGLLICPADFRKAAANMASLTHTNMSYFTCVDASETFPQSFLAGDRNLMTNGVRIAPGIVDLASQTNVAWSSAMHRHLGNAAMGDGSVQLLSSARLRAELTNSGLHSMRVAVP